MTHVLAVVALEAGDPIAEVVSDEADDPALHTGERTKLLGSADRSTPMRSAPARSEPLVVAPY